MLRVKLLAITGTLGFACATAHVPTQTIPPLEIPEIAGGPMVTLSVTDHRLPGWWVSQRAEVILKTPVVDTITNRVTWELARLGIRVGPATRRVDVEILDVWWLWRRIVWTEQAAAAVVRLRVSVDGSSRYVVGHATRNEQGWDAERLVADQLEAAIDGAMRSTELAEQLRSILPGANSAQ